MEIYIIDDLLSSASINSRDSVSCPFEMRWGLKFKYAGGLREWAHENQRLLFSKWMNSPWVHVHPQPFLIIGLKLFTAPLGIHRSDDNNFQYFMPCQKRMRWFKWADESLMVLLNHDSWPHETQKLENRFAWNKQNKHWSLLSGEQTLWLKCNGYSHFVERPRARLSLGPSVGFVGQITPWSFYQIRGISNLRIFYFSAKAT